MKGEQQACRLLSLPLFFMSDMQTLVQREMCADSLHPPLLNSVACGFLRLFVSCSVHQMWSPLTSTGGAGWRHPELGEVGSAFWWTGKNLFYLMGAAIAANLGNEWVMREGVRQELFLLALRGVAELGEKWAWAKAAIRCAENSQCSWCHCN